MKKQCVCVCKVSGGDPAVTAGVYAPMVCDKLIRYIIKKSGRLLFSFLQFFLQNIKCKIVNAITDIDASDV